MQGRHHVFVMKRPTFKRLCGEATTHDPSRQRSRLIFRSSILMYIYKLGFSDNSSS